MQYNVVVCGGTFDHLHAGHQAFLRWMFSLSKDVLIGLTSDEFVQATKKGEIQSFEQRKDALQHFLQTEDFLKRVTIFKIHDIFGPVLSPDCTAEAIVVTDDTYSGAQQINAKREEKGLPHLPIVSMPLVTLATGAPLSSTTIRSGKVDVTGESWIKPEWEKATFLLPEKLRPELHEPFGKILSDVPLVIDHKRTITVGDVTTRIFNAIGNMQHLSVVDFVVERKVHYHSLQELGFVKEVKMYTLNNPPGHIAPQAWEIVQDALNQSKRAVIHVSGEEDLLVLVCILVAPLGYRIYYGQPHEGLVEITVNLVVKNRAYLLMEQFIGTQL